MAYAVRKKINGSTYYYAAISVRAGERVILKTIKFLGKEDDLSKNQANALAQKIPQFEIDRAKMEAKLSAGIKPKADKKKTKVKNIPKLKKSKKKSHERAKPLSISKKKEILNIIGRKKATLDELKDIFG